MYVVFGCLPGSGSGHKTIALPSPTCVCGVWVFTWVRQQPQDYSATQSYLCMWCLGVYLGQAAAIRQVHCGFVPAEKMMLTMIAINTLWLNDCSNRGSDGDDGCCKQTMDLTVPTERLMMTMVAVNRLWI